jgi:HEAT repeat protein
MRAPIVSLLLIAAIVPPVFAAPLPADPFLTFKQGAGDRDPDDRVKAVRAIADYRSLESVRSVVGMLADPHPRVRRETLKALSGVADPAAVEFLCAVTRKAADENIRAGAAASLGLTRTAAARDTLLAALRDGSSAVRASAIGALESLGDPSAAEAVALRLKDPAWAVRAAAVDALAALEPSRAAERLAPALADREYQVRLAAVERIPRAAPDRAVDVLAKAFTDPAWQVRVAAVETAETLRRPDLIPLLIGRLTEEQGRLRGDLLRALRSLTGKEIGLDPAGWTTWWEHHGKPFTCPEPSAALKPSPGMTASSFCNLPVYSRRIAFVLDLSGSMRESAGGRGDSAGPRKVDVVKAELLKTVRSFTSDTRFNIVLLGSDAEGRFNAKERVWADRLTPATAAAQAHAARFVGRQLARGYTNLYDAVMTAFQDPEVDTVYLLSDGGASKGTFVARQEIVEEIAERNRFRKIAIHTIQSGARREGDRWLMTELAARTGGMTAKR